MHGLVTSSEDLPNDFYTGKGGSYPCDLVIPETQLARVEALALAEEYLEMPGRKIY